MGVFVAGLVNPARAEELQVAVACPAWTSEAAAQVEARIRTSFLAASVGARRVAVRCAADATSVEVEAERGTLVRPVVRRSDVLEDDVVATAEGALHELTDALPLDTTAALAAAPAPSAAVPAEAPADVAKVRLEPAKAPSPLPAVAPVRSKTVWRAEAGFLVERWDVNWAVGGDVGISAGSRALGYGLSLGGRAVTDAPTTFSANEWNVSARLQLAPRQLAGFRGSFGAGASLLVATPADGITADSSTQVSAAYLDVRVSRPFSFGSFALAPTLGARFFGASRDVQVNQRERLALPLFVPQAGLWLVIPGD